MKNIPNRETIRDDYLIFAVKDKDTKKEYWQRKRLPKNTSPERMQDRDKYFELKAESIPMVHYLRAKYDWTLHQSVEYIKEITGRKLLSIHIVR